MDTYRRAEKKEFAFMHVFAKIEGCPKWSKERFDLTNGADFDVNAPAQASSDHPIGNKKAKAAKHGAASGASSVEACFEKMMADVTSSNEQHATTSATRWGELIANSAAKLKIEEAKAAAAAVTAQAGLLQAMNAQLAEHAKILTANISDMDEAGQQ